MPDPKATKSPIVPVTVVKTDRQMSTVRFSPCGKVLAAAGRDGTVRRWDLTAADKKDEDPLATIDEKSKKPVKPPAIELPELPQIKGHDGWVTTLAFAKEGGLMFSADSWGRLCAWKYADKEPKPAWKNDTAHDGWIRALALSPDGKTIATCGMDRKVSLWNAADGKKLKDLAGHEHDIYSLAFHPDGKSLVSGDHFGVVKQWDLATDKVVRQFDASVLYKIDRIQDVGGVRSLAFDAEGKTLAIAGAKPESGGFVQGTPVVIFVDWATGKAGEAKAIGAKTDVYIHELVWHRDGYFIGVVSGQPGQGFLFFLRPSEAQPFFQQKSPNCHSVAIHPEGKRFAHLSNAGTYGQGPSKAKEGDYPGNTCPINVFDFAPAETA